MPIDGCFLHYLTDELNKNILNGKINKIYQPNPLDILFQIRSKGENGIVSNKQLLLSSRLDSPRINLSTKDYKNPEIPLPFCMLLRKYIERGEIVCIKQHNNDRIIELHISTYNELDDHVNYIIVAEIMGRNSNIILLDNNYIIIDAIRKLPPSLTNTRTIIPHAKYLYPNSSKTINPFLTTNFTDFKILEGVCKQLESSLSNKSNDEIISFLHQPINPVIWQINDKKEFYAYPLDNCSKVINSFPTLSSLLDYFYNPSISSSNYDASNMEKEIKKHLKKALVKKEKLENDLTNATNNICYNDLGILLQTNLYKVKKGDKEITVDNFLTDNTPVTIPLNPLLDPTTNLKNIFSKSKKAKTALVEVTKQLDIIEQEIDYLDTILFQISIGNNADLEEIRQELVDYGYITNKKKMKVKNKKIELTKFKIGNSIFYVGKNNLQNDYLTNHFARGNDYWFHVKDIPGSHVILKIEDNNPDYNLSEEEIRGGAMLASFFSKAKNSSSVPVDYTKVKNLKKIKGLHGSKVIITTRKTIYIDPSYDFIKEHLIN